MTTMNSMRLVAALLLISIAACSLLGVPEPRSFDERLAAGYVAVSALRVTTASLLDAGSIELADAENLLQQTDAARQGLDVSRALQGVEAEDRLVMTLQVLAAAQAYLCQRSPTHSSCIAR